MSLELPQEYGTFSVCVKYKSMYNMPVRDKQSWMLYKIPYSLANLQEINLTGHLQFLT